MASDLLSEPKPVLVARITELELQNARLALSNRMLRDRLRDLIDLLADFGVYQQP